MHEHFDLAAYRCAQQQQVHDSFGIRLNTVRIDHFDIRGEILGGIDQFRSRSRVKPEWVNNVQFGMSHNEA